MSDINGFNKEMFEPGGSLYDKNHAKWLSDYRRKIRIGKKLKHMRSRKKRKRYSENLK